MKVTMRGDDMKSAVGWVARLCPTNPAVPVLGGIVIDANDGIRLTAFDLETAGTITPSTGVLEPGRCLVPGRLLAAVAKTFRLSDVVDLVADDRVLHISTGLSSWTLPLMDVEEFPQVPSGGAVLGEVDAGGLRAALDVVSPACAKSTSKVPELIGTVRLTSGPEGLILAATDRYRIAYSDVSWAPALDDEPVNLVAPVELLELAVTGVTGQVTLRTEGGTLAAETVNRTVTGRQVDSGHFPAMATMRRHLHVDVATTVTVDVAEMIHAIGSVTAIQRDARLLSLELTSEGGLVSGSGAVAEGTTGGVERFSIGMFEGEDTTVTVQADYLLDGLKACADTAVLLLPANPLRPFLIRDASSGGEPLGSYQYLLMTIRPTGA